MRRLRLAQPEGAVLDRLVVVAERVPGAAQPSPCDGGTGLEAVVLVEPHGALTGAPAVADVVEARVRLLASVDAVVETADPPRRLGQHVEPRRLTGRIVVARSAHRRVVRALPIASCERDHRRRDQVGLAHGVPTLLRHADRR